MLRRFLHIPTKSVTYRTLSDDVIEKSKNRPLVGRSYPFVKSSFLFRVTSFLLYRVLMTPIAFFYSKIVMGERIVNRRLLPKRGGYFLLLNHTEAVGDAFSPSVISFPKAAYTVVDPDNFTLPVLGGMLPYLGAIPVPDELRAIRPFTEAIAKRLSEGCAVAVYPEGRLWEGCGFIRPLERGAFDIALSQDAPVYLCTRVYYRSRLGGYYSRVYIDKAPEVDESLPQRQRAELLRQASEEIMKKRAAQGDAVVVEYVKEEPEEK